VIWVVLAVIWFGIADDLTPIFLIFIVTFPVVFLTIFSGLESVDLRLVEMASFYRCSQAEIVRSIYVPTLVPHFISAVSLGLSFAWKSTIFAEFIGSSSGIGFAISLANANLETEKLFAWAIVLILIMLVFEYGILAFVNQRVTRWKQHG
jgi:NitT/TauT family transport system permease protein